MRCRGLGSIKVFSEEVVGWCVRGKPGPSVLKLPNRGDPPSLERLRNLPGFVPGEYAVTPTANKRFVLEKMEERNVETLPVVDSQKRFVGMVERTRLTASLIIEVAEKLEGIGSVLK